MQFAPICIECQIRRQRLAVEDQPDRAAARQYLLDCLQIIHDAPEGVAAPWFVPRFNEAWQRYFPPVDRYEAIKRESNAYALAREEQLARRIAAAEDPLYAALNFARVGNYLDFGALGNSVRYEQLDALVEQALGDPVDPQAYAGFCADLAGAQRLLYLTDNAGEIVFDKLLLRELIKRYPSLSCTVGVRGGPALNDALLADAEAVGLTELVPVIDTGVNIPGTQLSACSEAFQAAFAQADVILAKGQGNFETLWGCGANVYYLFLCKCELFTRLFQVPQLTGMFIPERKKPLVPGAGTVI